MASRIRISNKFAQTQNATDQKRCQKNIQEDITGRLTELRAFILKVKELTRYPNILLMTTSHLSVCF
jgi:hypothetical protein